MDFSCNFPGLPWTFSGLFSGLEKSISLRFDYDEKIDFLREKIRNTGISSETTIPGISSEPTETRESRVSRLDVGIWIGQRSNG